MARASAVGGAPAVQAAAAALPANWLASGMDRRGGAGISQSQVKAMVKELKESDAATAEISKQQQKLLADERVMSAAKYAKKQVEAVFQTLGKEIPD